MANGFSQRHYLNDLLINKKYEKILPQFKMKETQGGFGVSVTSVQNQIINHVFILAKNVANTFYNEMNATMGGNTITISGTLKNDLKTVYHAVYNEMRSQSRILTSIATNRDVMRSALKESQKNLINKGIRPKLWLPEGMLTNYNYLLQAERDKLVEYIINNIKYGYGFEETQKKFGFDKDPNYAKEKRKWQIKIGEINTNENSPNNE